MTAVLTTFPRTARKSPAPPATPRPRYRLPEGVRLNDPETIAAALAEAIAEEGPRLTAEEFTVYNEILRYAPGLIDDENDDDPATIATMQQAWTIEKIILARFAEILRKSPATAAYIGAAQDAYAAAVRETLG